MEMSLVMETLLLIAVERIEIFLVLLHSQFPEASKENNNVTPQILTQYPVSLQSALNSSISFSYGKDFVVDRVLSYR